MWTRSPDRYDNPEAFLAVDSQTDVYRHAARLAPLVGRDAASRRRLVELAREKGFLVPVPALIAELGSYRGGEGAIGGRAPGEPPMDAAFVEQVGRGAGGAAWLNARGAILGRPMLDGSIAPLPVPDGGRFHTASGVRPLTGV